jgi:hypothetical protein
MSVNSIIITALSQLGYPCVPNVYTGSDKYHFTFNYVDDRGSDFGDDEPSCTKASMQIHFFLPINENGSQINYIALKKKVRELLFTAGFTYPAITELTEAENNIRHIVYECDITEEREE